METKTIRINNKEPVIELSKEQQYAFQRFKKGQNLFITGQAGTGKTRLVKEMVDYAKMNKKKIQICAMTGCAAILLGNEAKTIHSWSGIKIAREDTTQLIDKICNNSRAKKNWTNTDILVLDEVSMCSKKIFEVLNQAAKYIRRNDKPFGGIQVIFTGDFFQLPPVPTQYQQDTQMFCFESPYWKTVFPMENHVELKTVFRQKDSLYKKILSEIREGVICEESMKILKDCEGKVFDPNEHNGCYLTRLFPTRDKVNFMNKTMFEKIEEPVFTYPFIRKSNCKQYIDSGKDIEPEVLEICNDLSITKQETELNNIVNSNQISEILELKKGAAVMCLVNVDLENGICNGSQGTVVDFNGKIPIVKFSNGVQMSMDVHYYQSNDYPTLAIGQIPLTLAWAITIHKSQGATLSMAQIDIGTSVFEYGQSYVALSRVESLNGLYLNKFNFSKIKANPKVVEFYEKVKKVVIEEVEEENENSETKKVEKELDFEKYTYKETEESSLCVMCISNEKNIILLPCKHLCLCKDCSYNSKLKNCPICRTEITEQMRIFSS